MKKTDKPLFYSLETDYKNAYRLNHLGKEIHTRAERFSRELVDEYVPQGVSPRELISVVLMALQKNALHSILTHHNQPIEKPWHVTMYHVDRFRIGPISSDCFHTYGRPCSEKELQALSRQFATKEEALSYYEELMHKNCKINEDWRDRSDCSISPKSSLLPYVEKHAPRPFTKVNQDHEQELQDDNG